MDRVELAHGGAEQVEVLGEADSAHQVAAEITPSHLDPVGISLADVADWGPRPSRSAWRFLPVGLERSAGTTREAQKVVDVRRRPISMVLGSRSCAVRVRVKPERVPWRLHETPAAACWMRLRFRITGSVRPKRSCSRMYSR